MESILQVNHLKKVFHQRGKRDVPAVNDVSFCLYPGEILGIVGESGSGKSTVAKLITRLVDPTEGEIILDGQDIIASERDCTERCLWKAADGVPESSWFL